MPNRLMEKLVVDELGFCCVYAYFTDVENAAKDNATLAKTLGVTERSIRWHKQQIREGMTTCDGVLACQTSPMLKSSA